MDKNELFKNVTSPWIFKHPNVLYIADGNENRKFVLERTCHDTGVRYPGWTCSECSSEQMHAPHFCPDCGAKVIDRG